MTTTHFTLLKHYKNEHDTCFGDVAYVTRNAPLDFKSNDAVIVNNYTTNANVMEGKCGFPDVTEEFGDTADYSNPIYVSFCRVYDVMHETTTGLTHV